MPLNIPLSPVNITPLPSPAASHSSTQLPGKWPPRRISRRPAPSCRSSPSQNSRRGLGRVTHCRSAACRSTCREGCRCGAQDCLSLHCNQLHYNQLQPTAMYSAGAAGTQGKARQALSPLPAHSVSPCCCCMRQPHLAVECLCPVDAGVIEVWVADGNGCNAARRFHVSNNVRVAHAHAVPQHVAAGCLD